MDVYCVVGGGYVLCWVVGDFVLVLVVFGEEYFWFGVSLG